MLHRDIGKGYILLYHLTDIERRYRTHGADIFLVTHALSGTSSPRIFLRSKQRERELNLIATARTAILPAPFRTPWRETRGFATTAPPPAARRDVLRGPRAAAARARRSPSPPDPRIRVSDTPPPRHSGAEAVGPGGARRGGARRGGARRRSRIPGPQGGPGLGSLGPRVGPCLGSLS